MKAAFGTLDFEKFGLFEAEDDLEVLMLLVYVMQQLFSVERDFAKRTLVAIPVDFFGDCFLSRAKSAGMGQIGTREEPRAFIAFEAQSCFLGRSDSIKLFDTV